MSDEQWQALNSSLVTCHSSLIFMKETQTKSKTNAQQTSSGNGHDEAPKADASAEKLSCTHETSLKPDQRLELYRYLKLTRLVEERLVNLYRQTKVVGGVYRSLGQEATAVGSAYALRPDDFITPIIRDLGACFVKGIRPREILAQYMAKAWGPSGGKDLNVHFGYLYRGFIGPISHLGEMV